MERNEEINIPILEKGQAAVWQHLYAFADSMVLKCAVELHIADIIHSHNGVPITLNQIASEIDSPTSPNIPYLARIMRFLVHKKIFSEHHLPDGSDTDTILYGSTETSKWLLHDAEMSLVPVLMIENNPWLLAPWHCLSQCVKEGGVAFQKAHGCDMWDFAAKNSEFNNSFNDAMASVTKVMIGAVLSAYKDGFNSIGSLVDVGGGTGQMIAKIVESHQHIKAINFDLPHVVATAPFRQGVSHVGGNMFESIPSADAVSIKFVLHDWSDEDCIKILKNCKKAIPAKSGKVIIVDNVLDQKYNEDMYQDIRMVSDLVMMAHTTGGKDRTELEWKKLLMAAGFPRYKIIKVPSIPSIIEAYPVM